MIKAVMWLVPAMVLFWDCQVLSAAATYYVDFAEGDNTADGGSPQSAWKHSPGDPLATDRPLSVGLAPGDTIIFKGGVTYHGAIKLQASGAPDQPITLDGNTSGKFGKGRAIFDGGRVITSWQRCASIDAAGGNPRWNELYFADIDVDVSPNFQHGEVVLHRQAPPQKQAPWQRVILFDGDSRLLPISQSPKPSDPFYPDLPADFLVSSERLATQEDGLASSFADERALANKPSGFFEGLFVGLHGGNNHVYFAVVQGYDPASHRISFAPFKAKTYPETRFALYNSVRLIERPGEWAISPLEKARSRIFLLPERLENGQPVNVGFPVFETAVTLSGGSSHIRIRGFLVQRYAGGAGGISVSRDKPRSQNVGISDCEIRFVSGHAGIGLNNCDNVTIENNYVHHCPGWTTGIFLIGVNDFAVRNCRLDKNSGSGIRHYDAKRGKIHDNVILNHYGMHSSTINLYEGCQDIEVERNYMHNTVAINRNAENIIFRNNVVDSQGRAAVNVAMWNSGKTGGRAIRNILFENNTFLNVSPTVNYASSIFTQAGAAPPEDIVVRNNILDRLRPPLAANIENNIFLREVDASVQGAGAEFVTDATRLFLDPEKGDYRRRPGGPLMSAGANLPPPPATWNGK